ncbi:hypothetical protein PIB30_043625 [Stylosanthes scabra]|uniref:Uncharacterized protein n=1 Tax=Stylosanthes scabra TaxID=79078 RepID=A0ABU6VHH7_9FABA|nr:hypothetical protein [Stylosanthes scabra]
MHSFNLVPRSFLAAHLFSTNAAADHAALMPPPAPLRCRSSSPCRGLVSPRAVVPLAASFRCCSESSRAVAVAVPAASLPSALHRRRRSLSLHSTAAPVFDFCEFKEHNSKKNVGMIESEMLAGGGCPSPREHCQREAEATGKRKEKIRLDVILMIEPPWYPEIMCFLWKLLDLNMEGSIRVGELTIHLDDEYGPNSTMNEAAWLPSTTRHVKEQNSSARVFDAILKLTVVLL